jgi:glycerol-3-phosphate dehydrogenase (NAD(P)+)
MLWARTGPRHANLPREIALTTDLSQVTGDVLLLAVPVQHMRPIVAALPNIPIVACNKGVEALSLRLPLEIVGSLHLGVKLAVLSGPNFAHEIAGGLPSASVLASHDAALREQIITCLSTSSFRLYGSADPIGVQIGGAAKNVIAIAAGAVMGAGLGENARAALITRGIAEIGRLSASLGGEPTTTTGLSGLGDLLLTCNSLASRNYSLGVQLGEGQRLVDILAARTSVAEGVATAPALVARGSGLDLPICQAVASLLAGRTTVQQATADLLARPRRNE